MGMLRFFKKKSVSFGELLLDTFGNQAGWTPATYKNAVEEGYCQNHVAHLCIQDIARCGASMPVSTEDPEIKKLLKYPAPNMPWNTWIERMILHKMLSGNAYAQCIQVGRKVKALPPLRPDRIEVVTGKRSGLEGELVGYKYTRGAIKFFAADEDGESELFHTKFYHPMKDHVGLSPVEAAMQSIDQQNEIARINQQTLKNDGAPKGFLKLKPPTNGGSATPTQDEMERIRDDINHKMGPNNRGRFAVLNWDFSFEPLSSGSNELNWQSAKAANAREIAMALGYPAFLLGLSEGATYNNVAEARLSLWENTVIPITEGIIRDLELYLENKMGRELNIRLKLDDIVALAPRHKEKRRTIRENLASGLISQEEARQALQI